MAEFQQSLALIIGINAYGNGIPPLDTARHDAEKLAEILEEQHEYEVILLLDEQASLAAIRQLVREELPQRLGPSDRLFFYFAGHGIATDSDTGPNGYLLPQDASVGREDTYLHMPVFHDALCELECRHMLVILDSCFGGAFRWSSTRSILDLPTVIREERFERFTTDPAWQVLTSASHDETAADQLTSGSLGSRGHTHGDSPHSPFALALFDGLQGAADVVPSDERDGVITASELYVYINERISRELGDLRMEQTPRLWPLQKHDKGEYIFLVPGHELNLPPAPEINRANNPYLGLRAYEQADAHLFYGRKHAIEQLQTYVAEHPLTVVLGASGTGKSSLVKAGLLPELESDFVLTPTFRPGQHPLQGLAQSVSAGLGEPELTTPESIRKAIRKWIEANPEKRLVLCIDQYEEVLTMCHDPDQREAFQVLLASLLKAFPDQLRVIVTVRLDFEPQFDEGPLEPWWDEARFVVTPMTQDELRDVIEKPASEMVLRFEPPELIDTLINEVISTPGGLPLLSFALSEMYLHYLERNSDDRAIEQIDFEAVGGVVGSLRSRADQVYKDLPEDTRPTMQRVMLRMVSAESGNELARRRVSEAELDFEDETEDQRISMVVEQLVNARLVVKDQDEDDTTFIEPAHDALVRSWDKLIAWVNNVRRNEIDNLRFRRSLGQTAQTWLATTNKVVRRGELWNDSARAGQLKELMLGDAPWMNALERRFARASVRSRVRSRRFNQAIVVLIAALGLFATYSAYDASISAGRAENSAAEAEQQRDRALSAALAIRSDEAWEDNNVATAILYSVQAFNSSETPESYSAMMTTMQRIPALHLNREESVELTLAQADDRDNITHIWPMPNGHTVLTTREVVGYHATWPERVLELWDNNGEGITTGYGEDTKRFTTDPIQSASFHSNGSSVLMETESGSYYVDAYRDRLDGVFWLGIQQPVFADTADLILGLNKDGTQIVFYEREQLEIVKRNILLNELIAYSRRSDLAGISQFAITSDASTLVVAGPLRGGGSYLGQWRLSGDDYQLKTEFFLTPNFNG